MPPRVRLNSAGVTALLKSPHLAAAVKAKADEVAANVEQLGIRVGDRDGGKHEKPLPVDVRTGTTDRVRAQVSITHPAGLAVQAKHGALTKAAAAAGLTVRSE